jgi:flagellar assembly protein FliH
LKAKGRSFWQARGRRRSLSKKAFSQLFHPIADPGSSFKMTWPVLSSGADAFSSHPAMKEVEKRMLKEVREKAQVIEKEAYEKGFEQGEKDGRELGLKRLEVVIQQWTHVLLDMERQRKEFPRTYRNEVLKLLLGIAKRIFRRELLSHEEVITVVLQEAFRYVTDRGKVRVRLSPADYQYLCAHPDEPPFSLDENSGVTMVEDPSITRGGCLLETSFGEIDATFESQFDEIVSQILRQMDEQGRHLDQ